MEGEENLAGKHFVLFKYYELKYIKFSSFISLLNLLTKSFTVVAVPVMPQPPPSLLGTPGGIGGIGAARDVGSRIAELQARIQAQLGSNPTLLLPGLPMGGPPAGTVMTPPAVTPPKPPGEQSKPTPLILDAEGRTVDQSGKEVHLTQRIPTLKVYEL